MADSTPIVVYGTPWCPMVRPVTTLLDSAGVAYQYIDIREDAEGRARVREINNGFESVPTLVFPDGSTLTEPGIGTLKSKLQAMGAGGPALDSPVTAVKATLKNPVTLLLILSLVAAVLVFAIAVSV